MKEIDQWFQEKGFKCIKQIGQGSFGTIYSIKSSHGENLCAKVEILNQLDKSYLIHEAYILNLLKEQLVQKKQGRYGILDIYSYDIIQNIKQISVSQSIILNHGIQKYQMQANIIFMEFGGVSLYEFRKHNTINEVLWFYIFKNLLITFQDLHKIGIIHRDLKPQNLLIKIDKFKNKQLFVIDFGLARMLKKTNQQVFYQNTMTGFAGTINYASIRAHKGESQHFSDDLEALMYVMLYLQIGQLPWMSVGIKHSIEDLYNTIKLMKMQLTQNTNKDQDSRFKQFQDKLTINQIQFMRFYCDCIFKNNIGNSFKKVDYSVIIQKIDKICPAVLKEK